MTREATFLDGAGWAGGHVATIPSDASDRSYLRLQRADGATAILMRAPVTTSDAAARQFAAFRRVADWLRERGLAAPAELAADPEAGFLLLEDLGEVPLSALLDRGAPDAREAYGAALSVLVRLAAEPGPDWMTRPDATGMAAMVDLTFSLLPGSEALAQETRGVLEEHLGGIWDNGAVSLRDVHGDNLIWRPDRAGPQRIGLLDFQDALVLPEGYDLASLVDDPRRTVPEAWRDELIHAHAAANCRGVADMSRRVDLLSLQRNLRILGIFRRLATELGRPAYARFLPRTRTLLTRSAGHAELQRLRPLVAELLERTAHWQAEAA
jgi:aminoglycoside/choline kinase family phosphotransferase